MSEWMAPAARVAAVPSPTVQALTSSLPTVKKEIEPHHPVGCGDEPVQRGPADAEIGPEAGGVRLGELAHFALDPGRKPDRGRTVAGRPVGERGQDLGLAPDLVLVQVDRGDERFLRQETEAPDEPFLVGAEFGQPERRLRFEDRPALLEDGELPDVTVAFFGGDLLRQALDPALDDAEVAQEELRFDRRQVPPGVDRFQRVRDRRIAEGADDGQEGVRRPQLAQELLAEGGLPGVPGGKALELDELDGRSRLLLGLEDRGQLLEPGIGDLDHGDGIGPFGATADSVVRPVRAEKSELLPERGRPTMQIFTFVFLRGIDLTKKLRKDYTPIGGGFQESLTTRAVLV